MRERQRHQPLERPRRALAQHRDRGDEEHRHEREQAEQRRADVLEDGDRPAEELLQQRLEQARHADDERDRARVAAQLREHARGDGAVTRALIPLSTSRRNASSSWSAPVCARSSAGVSCASSRPSRRRRSASQRSASSMTWLETSSVAPRVGEAVEELPEVAAEHRVEADGRLVEDEQLRVAEQRGRERDARALAAGEARDDAVGVLVERDVVDRALRPRPRARRARARRSAGSRAR